jgi:hypothetical protein
MFRILVISLLICSCVRDKDTYITENQPTETKEIEKEVVVEKEVIKEVEKNQPFEGVFGCPNNGLIELYEDSQDRVYIEAEGWQVVTINPKVLNGNNFADHPSIDAERLPKKNGFVTFEKDISYNSGNNLREDKNNDLITGTKRTKLFIESLEDGIKIRIEVYNKKIDESNQKRLVNRTIVCN